MIEQVLPPEELPKAPDDPIRLRRVAGMDDVESPPTELHDKAQQPDPQQRPGELTEEADLRRGVERHRVAVDVHALNPLARHVVALELGADHADLVALLDE